MNLKETKRRINDASVSGMIHSGIKRAGKSIAKHARTLVHGATKAPDETVDEFAKLIEGQAASMLSEGRKEVKGDSMLCIKITPPTGINLKGQEQIELRGVTMKDNAIYAFYMPKDGEWRDTKPKNKSRDLD